MNKKILAVLLLLIASLAFAADKYISSSGNIVLKTAATKNVNLQDSVYVKQTGEVGIGTPNPATALHIYNTGSETLTLEKGNNAPSIGFKSNNSKAWSVSLTDTTSGKLGFYNNLYGASVLTLQQDGNVGIGTVSPSTTLDVVGGIKTSTGIKLPNTSGGTAAYLDHYEVFSSSASGWTACSGGLQQGLYTSIYRSNGYSFNKICIKWSWWSRFALFQHKLWKLSSSVCSSNKQHKLS